MGKESELRKAILAAASVSKVDLTAPANAFTLWSAQSPGGVGFCGGRAGLNEAMALAREHVNVKALVILSADPKHGLTMVPDDDRVKPPPKAYPGSGL